MEIDKSTRHSKITGDFAEALVLYWLSKYGFECARIDHTGIDLIANNLNTGERFGISVKSRSRTEGQAKDALYIPTREFAKVQFACEAFGCEPYFAIVIDADNMIRGYILSMSDLKRLCPPTKANSYWKMGEKDQDTYLSDRAVKSFVLTANTNRWWSGRGGGKNRTPRKPSRHHPKERKQSNSGK